MSAITITPIATFRTDDPYPFCPGCGHGPILDRLNEAMVKLDLDPAKIVIVSDIGCSGLSDQYFVTSAFHGLHGRSTTYATGIKLAKPDLDVVVIMGDGGTGIGGTHLISAARRTCLAQAGHISRCSRRAVASVCSSSSSTNASMRSWRSWH